MFLEKNTYPWSLKCGNAEIQVVSRALMIAAESDELTEMEADTAERMHHNMERIIKEKLEKDRQWREQREQEGGKRRSPFSTNGD
jgi:hypothetical protein